MKRKKAHFMNKLPGLHTIFREFVVNHPKQFFYLFFVILFEGGIATLSVVAVIPLAEYLLDNNLSSPSMPSMTVSNILAYANIPVDFWSLGTVFVALNMIKALVSVLVRYAVLKIKYDILEHLTEDTLKTFFESRWEFFSQSEQGSILNTMYKELGNIGDTLGHLATLLAQIIQLTIYLILPICIAPLFTLTAFFLAISFSAPFFIFSNLSYKLGKDNITTGNKYVSVITETFSAVRLIFGFGRQGEARYRYLEAYKSHVEVTLKAQTLSAALHNLFQPLAIFAVVISMGFAIKNNASLPDLIAVMWSLLSALPILASIIQGRVSINNFLPSYEQLIRLRNKALASKEISGDYIFNSIKDKITLHNVSFSYPGRTSTLNNISLEFQSGKTIALLGESGAGKSTIVDLVLGLQVPFDGGISIDGVPLNEWNINSFRERVGYVPQDCQLFDSTIRDNLLWANKVATDHQIWEALDLANAGNFIRELPDGIDTVVGDRGVRLSGGQRQRISLARALIRKPALLILDEATSSLDVESEKMIQKSIEKISGNLTIILIAHRLSTVVIADYIYILFGGSVIESGRYLDLSTNINSKLSQMLSNQNL